MAAEGGAKAVLLTSPNTLTGQGGGSADDRRGANCMLEVIIFQLLFLQSLYSQEKPTVFMNFYVLVYQADYSILQ